MKNRFMLLAMLAVCVTLGMCLNGLLADQNAPSNWKALEKAYAEANVELAKARLAQAKSENQTVKGSVSDGMMDELAAGVQLTQDRLKLLQNPGGGDPFGLQITAAANALRGLEDDHAESVKANSIQAGAVPEAELSREVAEVAVAKARLAVVKDLAQQPADVRLQWELLQLQDQIRALWARPLIED
jgi:hypothetical protein